MFVMFVALTWDFYAWGEFLWSFLKKTTAYIGIAYMEQSTSDIGLKALNMLAPAWKETVWNF